MDQALKSEFDGLNTKFDSLDIEVQNNNHTIKLIQADITTMKSNVKLILDKLTKIEVHTGEIIKNAPTLIHAENNDEFRFSR